MSEEIKRCPFRQTADGEFAECYRKECMAYAEKESIERSPMGGHMRFYTGVCQMIQNQEKK